MSDFIPLSVPNFEGNEEKYVNEAVSQGWVSTGGAFVERLENIISKYVGSVGAVACQSGTAALHMSLLEAGVGEDEYVLAPTLTFIAAVNPIKYVGARPIFMDCDDSLCIDPVKLESFCEQECDLLNDSLIYKRDKKPIRALVVVHVFGNLADMELIMNIAKKYKLKVIEDATEALGSQYEEGKYAGKMAGTIGDFGAYSFNGNKIITTGGGGMIVCNNEDSLKHLKYMSTQCKDDEHFYIHNEVGFNYRMTNVQAAIGVAQMEELEEFINRKNRNYELYVSYLQDCEKGYLLPFRDKTRSNRWFYSFVVNDEMMKKKIKEYILDLQAKGIQSRPIWGLINEQKPYINDIAYEIEKAKYYSDRVINLPCSTNISVSQIERVCDEIKNLSDN